MTPHEIMAVVSVKARNSEQAGLGESDMAELYDELMEARGECS